MSLRRNVIANFLGQGWAALMGLAFVPAYIHYLGIESYGLIGVFAVLQAWFSLLDFGMTPILTREMARLVKGATNVQTARDLLRGVEIVLGGSSAIAILLVWATSNWLAERWLKPSTLPVSTVAMTISLMGLTACARGLESLYRGCALGQDQSIRVNALSAVMATVRSGGAVGVLVWLSPSVVAFFTWQILVSLATLIALWLVVYSGFPAPRQTEFSFRALRRMGSFAGGMISIAVLSLLLTQVDKVLLSRLLSLADYGYYTLAAVIANSLYLIVLPISQAYFPKFSESVADDDLAALTSSYHQGSQLVSILLGPTAISFALFSEELLSAWTRNAALAHDAAPLLAALSLGTLLNCLMWIPYQVQLAYGHTRTALSVNLVAVIFAVPALLWITPIYGAIGAAWVWVALNASYLLIGVNIMYRHMLRAERWRWYLEDVAAPLVATTAVAFAARRLMPAGADRVQELSWILATLSLAVVAAFATAPNLRAKLLEVVGPVVRHHVG